MNIEENRLVWIQSNIAGLNLSSYTYAANSPKTFGEHRLNDDINQLVSCTVVVFSDGTKQMFEVPDGILTRESIMSQDGQHALSDVVGIYCGQNVLSVADYAFCDPEEWNSYIETVETIFMPNVTHIGEYSFYCAGYRSDNQTLVVGPKIKEIDVGGFDNCSNLREIYFPEVESIGEFAFLYCDIHDASLPKLKTAGQYSLYANENIRRVYVPQLSSIPTAFVTTEGQYEQTGDNGIQKLDARNAKHIDDYGLYNVNSLKELSVQSLTGFGYASVQGVTLPIVLSSDASQINLSNVWGEVVLQNADSIGTRKFQNCNQLRCITNPNLSSIGAYGFNQCYNLRHIDTRNLSSIEKYTFYRNLRLSSANLENVKTMDGLAFGSQTADQGAGLKYLYLPELTELKEMKEDDYSNAGTFRNMANLRTAFLPKCTTIPSHAFGNCSNLEYVECNNISVIFGFAFHGGGGCPSLKVLNLGQDLQTVPQFADPDLYNTTGQISYNDRNLSAFMHAGEKEGHFRVVCPDTLIESFRTDQHWSIINSHTSAEVEFVPYSMFSQTNQEKVEVLRDVAKFANRIDFYHMSEQNRQVIVEMLDRIVDDALMFTYIAPEIHEDEEIPIEENQS